MKTPADHLAARTKHLSRQRVYDAIKRIRAGETVEMRLHGVQMRVEPIGDGTYAGEWVVYVKNGRVGYGHVYKEGGLVVSETGQMLVHPEKIIGRITKGPNEQNGDHMSGGGSDDDYEGKYTTWCVRRCGRYSVGSELCEECDPMPLFLSDNADSKCACGHTRRSHWSNDGRCLADGCRCRPLGSAG